MQSSYTTKAGYLQSGSHSGQGGDRGHHGPRRLHQQGQHTTTRHQHIQSSQKGSHQQPQNKLKTIIKNIKQTGALNTTKYKQLYPTSAVPSKFYGLPKIHKAGTPLRPNSVQ